MPSKSPGVRVNPALLKWARESVAASVEDIATRLGVGADTVEKWEAGEESPTLRALERIASYCKRPLAALFLSEAPPVAPLPRDFRTLPNQAHAPLTRKSRIIIRRSRRLQKLAEDLLTELGLPVASISRAIALSENPEDVARGERERLGVTVEQQTRIKDYYKAFMTWRAALERINVFVFRFPMPLDESRGFSLADADPRVIVVNSSDSEAAKNFTLFHEYAHVLLRTAGLCLFEEAADPQGNPTEVFCNRFAASFLVPLDALLREEALTQSASPEDLRDEDVQHMAARFGVSRYVIWRRILEAGGLSERAYWERVNRWKAAPPVRGRIKRALPHAERCLRQRGPKFASLVLEAKGRNLITYRDLIDYIGLNPKDIGSLESRLRGDRGT